MFHHPRELGLDKLRQHHLGQAAAQIGIEGAGIDVRSLLVLAVRSLGVGVGELGDGALRQAWGEAVAVANMHTPTYIPLFILHTATRPVAGGLLAFSNRNNRLGCCALKALTCARFIDIVALLRFGALLSPQVARERFLELMEVVALGRPFLVNADAVWCDRQRPQSPG